MTSNTGKITQAEIVEIFGEFMPLEAVRFLTDDPVNEGMSIDDVRAELHRLAAVAGGVIPLTWRPITEWVNNSPGHIRSYADLWVRNARGDVWREPEAWFNQRTNEWHCNDGKECTEPLSSLPGAVVATHFMLVVGPSE